MELDQFIKPLPNHLHRVVFVTSACFTDTQGKQSCEIRWAFFQKANDLDFVHVTNYFFPEDLVHALFP